ncbi:uncharacterized protein LOC111916131 [Lactuca sativa]|nr:uncharacterized protein LOC111916131 [Lactuca sativa]
MATRGMTTLEKEKKELENTCAWLRSTVEDVNRKHSYTFNDLNHSEAKMERVLNILKTTSLICNSMGDDHKGIDKITEFGDNIKHHVKEVEAIMKAFEAMKKTLKDKEKEVEAITKAFKDKAKGKKFWTMVSCATTVLVVVSLVCFFRGYRLNGGFC